MPMVSMMLNSVNLIRPCARPQGDGKAGMALVVVLGLISLLLVSSVTFAIMMRVERASSANARNTIMARQAVKSALAYAIADIDRDIGSGKWPLWHSDNNRSDPAWGTASDPRKPFSKPSTSLEDGRRIYFWKDTFGSIDHSVKNNEQQKRAVARVMGPQMLDYLPFAIRHRTYAQRYGTSAENPVFPPQADVAMSYTNVISPEWVPMTIVEDKGNFSSYVVGRCAYLALNTSGYLEIPSLCREGTGDGANRRYGASPAEIQPVGDFFRKGDGDNLKDKNKGIDYETVAEIIRQKENTYKDKTSDQNGTVFADGAAFSAFNFAPVGRMPTNSYLHAEGSDFFDRLCVAGGGSGNGNDIDHHIECLRKHKAAIITAFKLAGLTQSSNMFRELGPSRDIKDNACDGTVNGEPCTVCRGTKEKPTPAYTLPKYNPRETINGVAAGVSEQALWAYLGLIDYIDDDNEPFYDDDIDMDRDVQQFARPATENTPLLNGFIATFKFFREETSKTITIEEKDGDGNVIGSRELPVFDGEHAVYGLEFNGKVIFSNRNAALDTEVTLDDIRDCRIDAKFGFYLVGDPWEDKWDEFRDKAERLSFDEGENSVKFDSPDGADIIFQSGKRDFGGAPICFLPSGAITNKIELSNSLSADMSDEQKNDAFGDDFPEEIWVGAAGRAYDGESDDVIRRVPAQGRGFYDEPSVSLWLASHLSSGEDYENISFRNCHREDVTTNGLASGEVKVWKTEAEARAAALTDTPSYTLKRKVVNVVMWSEMIDPAFSCASAAAALTDDDEPYPRSAISSHTDFVGRDDSDGGTWRYFTTSNPKGRVAGFDSFKVGDYVDAERFFQKLTAIERGNRHASGTDNSPDNGTYGNKAFDNLVENFRSDPDYCLGYFIPDYDSDNETGGGRNPRYSIFQRYFLTDADFVNKFPGFRDGIYRRVDEDGNPHIHADDFFEQFNSLHVRNGGLDSVGELGYLPIGPYATIRLFGFSGEGPKREPADNGFLGWGIATANDEANRNISLFNALPYRGNNSLYDRPFHRVLDFFCSTNKPTRGLVNINGADPSAVASAFNGAQLDDFLRDDIDNGNAVIDEDNAVDLFSTALGTAFQKRDNDNNGSFGDDSRSYDGIARHLSDIGWLYDSTDDIDNDFNDDSSGFFKKLASSCGEPTLDSCQTREAVIRNTCGLFTDRGLNFSIILRGEAFTPFLGRSDVRSEKGTTLASRTAFAQLWRDTEPDDDGNYPYFIQYFKIFDE